MAGVLRCDACLRIDFDESVNLLQQHILFIVQNYIRRMRFSIADEPLGNLHASATRGKSNKRFLVGRTAEGAVKVERGNIRNLPGKHTSVP